MGTLRRRRGKRQRGGGRREPAAAAAGPAQEALPGVAGRGEPTSEDWFLSFRTQLGWAEAGFSEKAGRAPSWSLAKVLPGEGQDVLRVLPQ